MFDAGADDRDLSVARSRLPTCPTCCDAAHPIHVSAGSAEPGEDPSILVVFPNDKPARLPTIVTTHT